MFKSIQIRYQTARSLPAPYAYFYTLSARTVFNEFLQVDLSVTYPDRDDIDDDELIAEGFTRDDDFTWSGRLGKVWQQTIATLADKTRLTPSTEDDLDEDDDFWDVALTTTDGSTQTGRPDNADDWHYIAQELMQVAHEAAGRERPLELTYLAIDGSRESELRLTASFVERTVTVRTFQNGRERTKKIGWESLQRVMSTIYEHDYDADEAQPKRPRRAGHWLNLGTDEWHDVGGLGDVTAALTSL